MSKPVDWTKYPKVITRSGGSTITCEKMRRGHPARGKVSYDGLPIQFMSSVQRQPRIRRARADERERQF